MPIRPAFLAVATGLVLAATPAAAQPSSPSSPAVVFGEQIDVRAVDVEVVVLDSDGRRVSGLVATDFELWVDGRRVPIEVFGEVFDGAWVAPRAPGAAGAQEADRPSGPGQLPPVAPGLAATHFLIIVDDYLTTIPRDRDRVLRALEEQIAVLGPEDLVAVVSFDGARPRLLVPWTTSRTAVVEELAAARGRRTRGLGFSNLLDSEVREMSGVPGPGGMTMMIQRRPSGQEVCRSVRMLESALERLVAGLAATLRSLPRPPGRRVALLLSGGWPRSVEAMLTAGNPAVQDCGGRGGEIYRPLYETANLLGYTLYPIDVPLRPGPPVDAADQDPVPLDGRPRALAAAAASQGELHATLQRLAAETGGRALLDGAKDRALERVAADARSYYQLGFTPDWQADDEMLEVEVQVLRPRLQVRHRRAFRDLSAASRVDHATESLLLFDLRSGLPPLTLAVGPPSGERGKPVVPLRVVVPIDVMAFVPTGGGLRADLELRVAALDDDGARSDVVDVPLIIEREWAPEAGAVLVHEVPLRLRRANQVLAVTLYDPLGGTLLAGRIGVDARPPGGPRVRAGTGEAPPLR